MPSKFLRVSRGHDWLSFETEPTWWHEFEVVGDENLIYSENHSRKGGVWTSGGEFKCIKNMYFEESSLSDNAYLTSPFGTYRYRGPQYAHAENTYETSSLWPSVTPSPDFILVPMGATAISRTIPTNPTSNLAQFIGELREGLPRKVGIDSLRSRTLNSRKAGSEYLNIEFGWKPLVKDIRSLAHSVINSEKILSQYERGSGIGIRRRYAFPTIVTVEEEDMGEDTPRPLLVTQQYTDYLGPKRSITTTSIERWFSGSYTYFLPPPSSEGKSNRKGWLQKANKLLGVRLTPELVWNLAPWSWASDWFANTGDVLKNVSAFSQDGLVLRYGYIMEQITKTYTITLEGIGYGNNPGPHRFSQTWATKSMQRLEATPYGFGLAANWSDFSMRQVAIASALGLSAKGRV